MTMPTSDGLHYAGCLCNDKCTCLDIECVHEQCICDRLSAAYQRGREAAYRRGREDAARGLTNWYLANGDEPLSEWESECVAAARGDGAK